MASPSGRPRRSRHAAGGRSAGSRAPWLHDEHDETMGTPGGHRGDRDHRPRRMRRLEPTHDDAAAAGAAGPPVQALSKRQLVRRAQAICLEAQSATGQLIPPPKGESVAGYLAKSAQISADRTAKLSALRPMQPVAARWRQLLSAERAFNQRMQSMQRAAGAGDHVELRIVQSDLAPAQALIGSARALGADLCAQ